MRRFQPYLSHPMLYGCGCGGVRNFNRLTTYANIRFFWIPLLTMKCSRTPFTNIYEWKRCSNSSGFSGSSSWIWVVAMGSTSMIYFPLSIFELELESRSNYEDLISATSDCSGQHSWVLCQGILLKSHHLSCLYSSFHCPSLYMT